jgi:hypothetical protein
LVARNPLFSPKESFPLPDDSNWKRGGRGDPNWKRKGPPIEMEVFGQAEAFLQTELVPPEEAELLEKYRVARRGWQFGEALECLVQLGERQACSNPYWRVLERLTTGVWHTQWMVDRREKGRIESRIAYIKRRARGLA